MTSSPVALAPARHRARRVLTAVLGLAMMACGAAALVLYFWTNGFVRIDGPGWSMAAALVENSLLGLLFTIVAGLLFVLGGVLCVRVAFAGLRPVPGAFVLADDPGYGEGRIVADRSVLESIVARACLEDAEVQDVDVDIDRDDDGWRAAARLYLKPGVPLVDAAARSRRRALEALDFATGIAVARLDVNTAYHRRPTHGRHLR